MQSSAITAGTAGLASQYNALRQDAYGGSMLLAAAQASPNMTLYINPGVFYMSNGTRVIFAGGNTPSFTAPVSNPRIDLVVINSAGTVSIVQGAEGASPAAPTYPTDKQAICEVYNTTAETNIGNTSAGGNGYVLNDVRQFLQSNFPNGVFHTSYEKTLSDATVVQTIAHGLGVAPRFVKITGIYISGGILANSFGTYDGSTMQCIFSYTGPNSGQSTSSMVVLVPSLGGNTQNATITVDATNINLSWTKVGSPTGLAEILVEARA